MEGSEPLAIDPAAPAVRVAALDMFVDLLSRVEDDPSSDAFYSGPIAAATRLVRATGGKVAQVHLRHLNPFPANTGEVLRAYKRVIVPEMNLGQLAMLLRSKYLVDIRSHNAVRGLPFTATELADVISQEVSGLANGLKEGAK